MIAMIASTAISAAGTIAAGNQQKAAGKWQQQENERQAMAERASAQRDADQLDRRRELAQSRLQTVGAASGLSTTDPTSLAISDEIERYGTMQTQMAQYGGEDRATGLNAQGAIARYSGDAAASGSRYRAVGTILGGIAGLDRYRNRGGGNAGAGSSSPYHFG
jgi:hypothetical protein